GLSYTVDTLAQLRGIWDQKAQMSLIIGTDEAIDVPTWKQPERVFDLSAVLVANRPGFDINTIELRWRKMMKFVRVPQIEVSSTAIRRRIVEGKSIRYLVPRPVEEFIRDRGLYLDR
ncbi:MAG: nicotinic acid mononucleotide adenylyltransferase, partial [Candidatus Latescibacterota bacterium]